MVEDNRIFLRTFRYRNVQRRADPPVRAHHGFAKDSNRNWQSRVTMVHLEDVEGGRLLYISTFVDVLNTSYPHWRQRWTVG